MKAYCWAVQLLDGRRWWTVATFASSRDAKACIRKVLFRREAYTCLRVVNAELVVKPLKSLRDEAEAIEARAVRS